MPVVMSMLLQILDCGGDYETGIGFGFVFPFDFNAGVDCDVRLGFDFWF